MGTQEGRDRFITVSESVWYFISYFLLERMFSAPWLSCWIASHTKALIENFIT
jgi:hypothetical protein